jgi:Baseplate J-like protein
VSYVDLPIETDPDVLKDEAVAAIQDALPGWEPASGNLETILVEAVAEMASEDAEVASQMPTAVFRKLGASLFGIDPIDGVQAIGSTTWTMTDALGHTIPAGTFVAIGDVSFETSEDVTVAIGVSTASVPIIAVESGEAANDLSGTVDLIDTLAFVDHVVTVGTTSGGVDAETDDEYLDRLTEEITLMAPRPIVPEDFEIMSRRIAGVDRSLAVDGFNPADSTYDNERMIAIAAIDEDGEAVSGTIKTAIKDYLEARREANFVVNMIDPTYETIGVIATVTVLPGFDVATTLDVAEGAVENYLQPYNFGRVSSGDGRFARPWVLTDRVGYLNIAEVIKRSEGIAFIETLTVNGHDGTDVSLSGAAPLTRPGTITITEA